jgi:hypothetical protein
MGIIGFDPAPDSNSRTIFSQVPDGISPNAKRPVLSFLGMDSARYPEVNAVAETVAAIGKGYRPIGG